MCAVYPPTCTQVGSINEVNETKRDPLPTKEERVEEGFSDLSVPSVTFISPQISSSDGLDCGLSALVCSVCGDGGDRSVAVRFSTEHRHQLGEERPVGERSGGSPRLHDVFISNTYQTSTEGH